LLETLVCFDWVFAKASAQLNETPLFNTRVGELASAEKVCFADSEAELIVAIDASVGARTTVSPDDCPL
jgi:hypothetical protein